MRWLDLFLVASLGVSVAGGLTALALYSSVRWRPLPFPKANELLSLQIETATGQTRWWSGPELQRLSEGLPGIDGVAGFTVADFSAIADRGRAPEALLATLVSADFFRLLGLPAHVGRLPEPGEFLDGGAPVVVLGHGLWLQRYGGDPSIVGRTVHLSPPAYLGLPDTDYRVIGVLPPQAWLFWERADLVLPLRAGKKALADADEYLVERVIARRTSEDVSPASLADAITRRLPPSRTSVRSVRVVGLATALFEDFTPQLRLVLAVALLVLCLAALNMAVAVAADSITPRHTDAIRIALGATAGRLARHAALRTLMSGAAAGLLSFAVSRWLLGAVAAALPNGWLARLPGGATVFRTGPPELVGLMATVALLVLGVSVWTLRDSQRLSVSDLLVTTRYTDAPSPTRWRGCLVGLEIAMGTAMLVIAVSLSSQLVAARSTEFGVDTDRTVAAWINPSGTVYADDQRRARYFEQLIERVSRAPGIERVGAVSLPFHFTWQTVPVRPEVGAAPVQALDRRASPAYADVSGFRIVDGRWLDRADDTSSAPVVVLSAALAQALWPSDRAIGRLVTIGQDEGRVTATVVGVVSDTRATAHGDATRTLFRPIAQSPPDSIYLIARWAAGAGGWQR